MGKGAVLSGLLHLAVVLLAVFGLPWLYNTNEVLQATPVSVISEAQFAELKNQKPPAQQKKQDQPKNQEIPPAPKAPDVAQPEPEAAEPTPPEPAPQPQPPPEPPQQAEQQQPAVQPEPPPELQQVVTPEPPPQPKPEPIPPPEPQVAEAQPKPVPPKKPNPPKKKDEPKKKEDTKKDKPKDEQVASDDTSFLKDIEKKLKKNQKKFQPTQQQAALPQDNYYGPPISEGEKDIIRQQIKQNWIIDIGMQGLEDMTVNVNVRMNPDGSVQSATIDQSSSNGHPNWPIYAESCQRAVLKSSPLRMPPDKPYEAWATMTLVFNARDMLGY